MVVIALGANEGLATVDSALQSGHLGSGSITSINLTDSPPDSPQRRTYAPPMGVSKLGIETGPPSTSQHYPTPTSPRRAATHHEGDSHHQHQHQHQHQHHGHADYEHDWHHDGEHEHAHAGPSNHGSRAIPPPPNPRRHRSGILMSRVRAASSGAAIKLGANAAGSKSHGDLASFGGATGFTALHTKAEEQDVFNRSQGQEDTSDELDEFDEEIGGEEGVGRRRFRSVDRDTWRRHVSEGSRNPSVDENTEDNVWDNSARYYHHIHSSRPSSRSASRSGSPDHSPAPRARSITSPHSSPIYVRRNLTLPHTTNGPGPPSPGAGLSASLSPNHHFLQTHLPPTFSSHSQGSTSPESNLHESHHGAAMVFTPTTQEWKDLQATPEWQEMHGSMRKDGEMAPSFSGSSSQHHHQHHSQHEHHRFSSHASHSHETPRKHTNRPILKSSISAEYLGPESTHTPDPGSPILTPADDDAGSVYIDSNRPIFNPVIIAPSPIMPVADKVATALESPTRQGSISTPVTPLDCKHEDSHAEQIGRIGGDGNQYEDDDIILADPNADSPVRFASIGRRDSLRVVKKPGDHPPLPRTKTKRELEREKLLQLVDEELEGDHGSPTPDEKSNGWGGNVQEIGSGLGLSSTPSIMTDVRIDPDIPVRPSSADPIVHGKAEPKNPFDNHFGQQTQKSSTAPTRLKAPSVSPTSTFKPSPLQASPVNATSALPTPSTINSSPADTPDVDVITSPPTTSATTEPPPPAPASSNLASIRDYARNFASRSRHPSVEKSLAKDASPPMSPRSPRRRDTNRVSLVAGRVVQPFAIPPSTALPPPSRPPLDRNVSLQSFSPFRSPALSASRPPSSAQVPQISRLDSTISIAPSTGAPSECSTPTDETAGGIGGRGIDDYVILKEAGKGAYGLVMRAKVKGPKGEPVGDEVIIKYIIKARILADCWKKHKVLGPIPVEIHVMDQLRHLLYHKPNHTLPWDPSRSRTDAATSPTSVPSSPSTSIKSDRSEPSSASGHPNIGKLLDFFEDREFYYLVMPRFGTGLDLFDHVESSPSGLDPFEVRSLIGQLADAVRFLHANGIVHRDIKDENVILDGSGRCQLIDFGSAAHWRPGKRWDTFSGTLHYASPEILRGEMYGGKEQDIWALGVVGYVLLVGETPFSDLPDEVLDGLLEGSRALEVLEERCSHGHEDEGLEDDGGGRLSDAADLVKRCLELEVADRPSAEVVVEHRYLKGRGGWTGKRGWVKDQK
ncbi:CAMK/CAMKL/PASK protein kinase [Kwoniella heveanensis CBS 569]|nr:CAMK/CAMKL/PASK protein kinase [Kwoniella heveanensis CBS 569]